MIDLNCDLGEGINNEHLLMPLISSCSIACGGHTGTTESMDHAILLAIQYGVKVGVHPSFPDKANFGRKMMNISDSELQLSLEEQMACFKQRAALQNCTLHHVKPHGALYQLIAKNTEKAAVVLRAIQNVFEDVKLYVPYNSAIEKIAQQNNMEICYEAFADRNYHDDLTLVSRTHPEAIFTNPQMVLNHVKRIVHESKLKTISGNLKKIKADTICIHGDHKNALPILQLLHRHLNEF